MFALIHTAKAVGFPAHFRNLYYYRFPSNGEIFIWECTGFCLNVPGICVQYDYVFPVGKFFNKWGKIVASTNNSMAIDGISFIPVGSKKIKKKDLILYSYYKYKSSKFFEILAS